MIKAEINLTQISENSFEISHRIVDGLDVKTSLTSKVELVNQDCKDGLAVVLRGQVRQIMKHIGHAGK